MTKTLAITLDVICWTLLLFALVFMFSCASPVTSAVMVTNAAIILTDKPAVSVTPVTEEMTAIQILAE
tara:strand:+ start:1279 stop:1482 length:204 start_codon:yes stop_codon:yes gene_type:complete